MVTENKYSIEELNAYKKRSIAGEVWRNYKKSPSAMIGLIVIIIIVIIAIIAQIVYDYNEDIVQQDIMNRLQGPSSEHLLGTDQYGRDVLIRILYGAKYSLSVGIVSVAISCILGSTLGLIAGYYGGLTENIILRACEIFMGIPSILLGIAIMSAFGQSLLVLMFAIGLVYVPMFARTARAAVLPVRDQEYIEAAKISGVNDLNIIFNHVLPNSMSPIIVQVTMGVANGILTASGLSFLGLGVPVPAPEWGAMLSSGREFIRDYSYLTFFPGLAIMITVLAFNLMGDGLRDALDPKLKQ
ncbi:ABC transporter permease [Sedimentibacter sp.]|uniref:ABC transporter permease n=1 Tax=Sedimentibacter sp. TaxID=1960295 RepID=UPI00289E87DE|nr:ABC transporter permease [Sedimentibacter sp.]